MVIQSQPIAQIQTGFWTFGIKIPMLSMSAILNDWAPQMNLSNVRDRIRNLQVEVLSDNWYILRKASFDFLRSDGIWQHQRREAYDRGNGAAILLYSRVRKTVLLTRQFRYPAWSNGWGAGFLIEVCAGLLDKDDPETAIRRETEEETGLRLAEIQYLFDAYMSPGAVTERLSFFVAEWDAAFRVSSGGGVPGSTEEIELVEMTLTEAMEMVASGHIVDAKTIMLLQWAALNRLIDDPA